MEMSVKKQDPVRNKTYPWKEIVCFLQGLRARDVYCVFAGVREISGSSPILLLAN